MILVQLLLNILILTLVFFKVDHVEYIYILNIFYSFFIYYKLLKNNNIIKATYTNTNNDIYDNLTKAYNRRYLLNKIQNSEYYYLLFCDLDNFKHLNDSLGHIAGDELLKQITSIWKSINIKEKFDLCRNGGDEFVFVLYSKSESTAVYLANKILEITKKQKSVYFSYISVSIGIAGFPKDTNNRDKILSYADTAMYQSKTSGKGIYTVFNDIIKETLINNDNIRSLIIEILKTKKFDMYYQPQINMATNKIIGFESLLRVQDKNNKFINTQQLINIAEQDNLIIDLDLLILNKVLSESKNIINKYQDVLISINISGKHISTDDFSERLYDLLNKYNFPPQNLELEITEESFIKNISITSNNIKRLKKLGIKIALDDFGTGYSSLQYLNNIPIDTIKIDKSFIDIIYNNVTIINLILGISDSINCKVIAEGVETQKQTEILQNLGCYLIQGFYFSKPLSLKDALNLNI